MLFKLILYVLLGYIIYQVIHFFQAVNKRELRRRTSKNSSSMMVKDDMCNLYLPKEDAFREVINGKEHFFCSKECHRKYLESSKTK